MDRQAVSTGTPHVDTGDGTAQAGDRRWPGPSREDVLGQRARHRSPSEIDETAVTTNTGAGLTLPEFPTLEDDVYLLDPDARTARARREAVLGTLHALALDTALSAGGDVVWVDSQGHAVTHAFARVAPAERVLERVHIARAFTTHQHHTLIAQLGRWLRGEGNSPFGAPATDRPAIVVAPGLDALYRDGELRAADSRAFLARSLAILTSIARDHDIPVVLTRSRRDSDAAPIERAATPIALEETRFGPRFECADLAFETLVYHVEAGIQQTTLAYWADILRARHPSVTTATEDSQPPTPATIGPGDVR